MELHGRRALAILILHDCCSDNLDALVTRSMSAGHVVVEHVDGAVQRNVAILTVHIMGAAARVVLHPHTKVLDISAVRLGDFVDVENLAGGLLHLSHLVHEVPEARLSHHFILRKDLHAISRRVLIGLGWCFTSNDLIQSHLCREKQF